MALETKYFVLKPTASGAHGVASRIAMRTYAREIGDHDPELAESLRAWTLRAQLKEKFKPTSPVCPNKECNNYGCSHMIKQVIGHLGKFYCDYCGTTWERE